MRSGRVLPKRDDPHFLQLLGREGKGYLGEEQGGSHERYYVMAQSKNQLRRFDITVELSGTGVNAYH